MIRNCKFEPHPPIRLLTVLFLPVAALMANNAGATDSGNERSTGPARAVLVTGIQTEYGDVVSDNPGGLFGPAANFTIDDLCQQGDAIASAMQAIVDQVELSMTQAGSPITLSDIEQLPDAPTRASIREDLGTVRDELCNQRPEPPSVYPFSITYAYCRMAMVTPQHAMDIHLPPGIGEGKMSMADHARREVMQLSLKRNMDAVAEVVGSGWSDQVNMRSPVAGGSRIGYDTTRYNFDYSGGLGVPGMGGMTDEDVQAGAVNSQQAFGNLVSMTNEGTVWVSEEVPGIDVVQAFYRNLTTEVQADQGSTSFFSGMINNLVGMLQEGLPLEIDQNVSSKVMGRTVMSGRTHSIVTSVRQVDFNPAWCSQSVMPPEYKVTDLDEQISQATADAPGAGSASSAEAAAGMKQFNDALQQMTPEQRKMMEQIGLGGVTPKSPATKPAAQSSVRSAPQPAASATRSAMPSSAELHSDNLTQMVQKHLQALGYDPGTTNGTMSLETSIAISQFQAEKGVKVTGEVSPQLAGLLSAEVDSRRR